MNASGNSLRTSLAALLAASLCCTALTRADDMASFATGGYAAGLRTMAMMHKIDTNHDGMVSRDEWNAFQEKMFAALDKDHSGKLDKKEFMTPNREAVAFATAAYVRGLQSDEVFTKIDADHDGTISHDEFIAYHNKLFEMMDRGKRGRVGPTDWIRKSG